MKILLPSLAALALAGFILPATARADALSDVVGRYLAWRGGDAYTHLQSFAFAAGLDTSGLHGTQTVWANADGRQRVDIDLGVIKQTQVIAPEGAWDISPSGQVESLSLADRHNLTREARLWFADAVEGRQGETVSLAAPEVRQGRPWAVARVRFGDDDVYDVLIDPETGELGGFHITEDRVTRFEAFGDWRLVDGVRLPFSQTVTIDDGDGQTLAVTHFELNQTIAADRLKRPPVARNVTFKDGATSSGWIDFEFYDHNRIFLPARINGREVMVLLDSGATVSAADKAYAAAAGLTTQGHFNAPGAGGVDTAGFTGPLDIALGAATIHGVKAIVVDFSSIAQRIGHPMPFVLGNEVFNAFAVDIDFAHHRLALRNPDSLTKPAGAAEVPLVRIKDRSVPVSIEGAPAVPFEFDLGDGSPLDIYPAYYVPHKLLDARPTSQVEAGGVGGFHGETVATIKRLSLAGMRFVNVPTDFTPDTASANNSNLLLGTVGLPILSRFHLIVDYSHDRLFATPDPSAVGAPFARDRLGMTLIKHADVAEIHFVSPGGPAEAAGLRPGDRVEAIDGRPVGALSDADLTALRFQSTGTTVVLTLADGRTCKVVRRDFF